MRASAPFIIKSLKTAKLEWCSFHCLIIDSFNADSHRYLLLSRYLILFLRKSDKGVVHLQRHI